MKKALIISYYWPPSGGGGVMRWLKMSKFFPELGWQPTIYTPENPDPSVTDESLLKEIHPATVELKTPIWEPYNIYRKLSGVKSNSKFKAGYISEASEGNWKSRLSVFIRGNFLIPDPRVFWVSSSVKFLSEYLKENPVDLIVSTGPPHSMHLIALKLKKIYDIPWIADFRDPWTDIDFYHKLKLTKLADKVHHRLEKKCLLPLILL
jgi:glycosyltransferase involved in cell wall biosynthesis